MRKAIYIVFLILALAVPAQAQEFVNTPTDDFAEGRVIDMYPQESMQENLNSAINEETDDISVDEEQEYEEMIQEDFMTESPQETEAVMQSEAIQESAAETTGAETQAAEAAMPNTVGETEAETVYPTSPYTGEPVVYEDRDGGEDNILEDGKVDIPEQTYSFSELVQLKEEDGVKTEESTAMQYLHVSIPDFRDHTWSEGNVLVVLYREGKKEEFWLIRQQDFVADVRVPVGRYTFGKAEANDGTRLFTDTRTFDVDDKIVNLELTLEDTRTREEDIVISQPEDVVVQQEERHIPVFAVVIAVIAVSALGFALFLLLKKHSDDSLNDYMR